MMVKTNDEIRTGAGDDQIIFGSESGSDAVDGGLGNDTLTLNWNTAGTTYLTVQRADSSWVFVGSSLDEIKANLADAIAFNYSSNGYGYYDELGNYQNHAGSGVTYQGIESLTLESGAYDDTLIYQNNQINRYAGNGGTDTFYADLSGWTQGIHWVNDGSEQTFSNGVEGFTISGGVGWSGGGVDRSSAGVCWSGGGVGWSSAGVDRSSAGVGWSGGGVCRSCSAVSLGSCVGWSGGCCYSIWLSSDEFMVFFKAQLSISVLVILVH